MEVFKDLFFTIPDHEKHGQCISMTLEDIPFPIPDVEGESTGMDLSHSLFLGFGEKEPPGVDVFQVERLCGIFCIKLDCEFTQPLRGSTDEFLQEFLKFGVQILSDLALS